MPKLRQGANDVEKFTSWIGRKCRNHHPLEELKLDVVAENATVTERKMGQVKRDKLPNIYGAKSKGEVGIMEQNRNTLVYDAGGRVFAITVIELEGAAKEAAREKKKIAVGG